MRTLLEQHHLGISLNGRIAAETLSDFACANALNTEQQSNCATSLLKRHEPDWVTPQRECRTLLNRQSYGLPCDFAHR